MTANSTYAKHGMFVAPHAAAAESGCAVLREGGNALEAMVAAAATISVVSWLFCAVKYSRQPGPIPAATAATFAQRNGSTSLQ